MASEHSLGLVHQWLGGAGRTRQARQVDREGGVCERGPDQAHTPCVIGAYSLEVRQRGRGTF